MKYYVYFLANQREKVKKLSVIARPFRAVAIS